MLQALLEKSDLPPWASFRTKEVVDVESVSNNEYINNSSTQVSNNRISDKEQRDTTQTTKPQSSQGGFVKEFKSLSLVLAEESFEKKDTLVKPLSEGNAASILDRAAS